MDISITQEALSQLRTVASAESVDLDDTLLRIAVVPGGCSGLTYDLGWDTTVQDEDQLTEIGGLRVVLDAKSALYLDGSELHFTDGLQGDGFHFSNPQATRSCACGESFGM
ncbi:iron-sulfur cluster assembly accessory protein [Longibacter salinarum]|uniref:Iron-sulfur cluster assembly accessory protein n=1 Tax=Longibacter salinarum TaxID=1850348 RepID=A0A2A8CZA3_9BACT|nr:iron-sulfur cluster assembly accessory protein [Longibacter salinarum]PEN13960.1 iron-sulfur cluster assembly accessory protein [Longibacter salinarum]